MASTGSPATSSGCWASRSQRSSRR
uniref:Uncharacterized protein n=1 Tax=Arundo donax TaxID=35708 RepID=A0A0A8YX50_ARUDO